MGLTLWLCRPPAASIRVAAREETEFLEAAYGEAAMPHHLAGHHMTGALEATLRSLSLTWGPLKETRRDNRQGLGALCHLVVLDGLRGLGAGGGSTEKAGKDDISVWKVGDNASSQHGEQSEGR